MASLFVFVPLLALLLLHLPVARTFFRRISPYVVGLLLTLQAIVAIVPPGALEDPKAQPWFLPVDISYDGLTRVLLLTIGFVGLSALVVARSTLSAPKARLDFESLLLASLAAMNGVVLVQDLFSLWLFIEALGVGSFVLVASRKEPGGLEGAFKYLLLSAVASVLMLAGVALLLMAAGNTTFAAIRAAVEAGGMFPAGLATILFLAGLFVKGGVVPFHGWLPDAYTEAPPAVSVLLAGIVTKVGGLYTLIRLASECFRGVPGLDTLLLVLGTASIFTGALAALPQKDMKRMLAWSSVSQVGYIVVALGAATPLGLAGAVFHLFNHAIFKTQLFVNAAAVEAATGTRDMDRMGGLSHRMPWTSGTSVVALFSTAGIPPLAGFWSKLIILIALWQAGHEGWAAAAILGSLVTLAYFLSLQRRVFFGKLAENMESVREAGRGLVVPAVLLAAATICVGVFFFFILETFILPVQNILG
ncbi:MAG: NADH-quinone oxidoreductase subunit L [Deltaproteobacteria bacterium]|nr:NADH-quinone oxidoreductase subunit L [Deltaproteobacteria bacterium]